MLTSMSIMHMKAPGSVWRSHGDDVASEPGAPGVDD